MKSEKVEIKNKKSKVRNLLQILFFFLLAVIFVWLFIRKLSKEEIDEIFLSFKNANYFWFFVAVLINLLSHYVRAMRWKQLIKPLGYTINVNTTFFAVMSGYLTNLVIPRLGEVVRCTMISRKHHIPFDKTFGTIITERAIDLILFFLIFLLSFLVEAGIFKDYLFKNFNIDTHKWIILGILFIAFCVISFLLLIIFKKKLKNNKIYIKIKDFFLGIWDGMKTILKLKQPLLFVFYSVFIWFLWILGTYVLFKSMPETSGLSFKIAMIVTVVSSIGTMITPAGIGVYPAFFAETLVLYAIVKPIGYALGWLTWLVSQVGALLLGPIGFMIFANKKDDERNRKDK